MVNNTIFKEVCQEEERIQRLEKAVAELYGITESLVGITEQEAKVQRETVQTIKRLCEAIGGVYGD